MRRIPIRAIVLAAAVAAFAAGALAGPASAGAKCTGTGPVKPDPFTGTMYPTTYCHVYAGNFLYSAPDWKRAGVIRTGVLYAGRSWFVCQTRGGENLPIGNARSNMWVYTLADTVYAKGGWGWVPAVSISRDANYLPIPWLRMCNAPKLKNA